MSNASKKWQVFVRKSAKHKWRVYGTYETRDVAREMAFTHRSCVHWDRGTWVDPLGFGNTKVVRKITGGL